MKRNHYRLAAVTALALITVAAAYAAPRTWTDKSGKFSISAEVIAKQGGNVVLRSADGRQLTVPIKNLSADDQAFLGVSGDESGKEPRRGGGKGGEIIDVAEKFFEELRSEKREAVGESLTTKAREVLEKGKSPLTELPAPEEGKRAVRLGRPKMEDKVAELPVQLRSGGRMHKCKLHLRQEEDAWRIFAMSATYPGGEKSINFETEAGAEGEGDPLEALVGKPFPFAGRTLDGQPLDMSRYQGKVVLVDFWATWCGPCREEMPNIFANYQKHYKDGFEVVAVSVDQDLEALAEFIGKAKPPWVVVADNFPGNTQPMSSQYGIRGIPAFILVGRDGKVAAVNCRGKKLGETLAQVLTANPAAPGATPANATPPGQTPTGQPAKVGNIPGQPFAPTR